MDLERKIRQANEAYSQGRPIMTDMEYDLLWQQLRDVDPENELLYLTCRPDGEGMVAHRKPALSLQKAMKAEELVPFYLRYSTVEWILQPKYNGIGVMLYENALVLFGDGYRGLPITQRMVDLDLGAITEEMKSSSSGVSCEAVIPWDRWNPSYGSHPLSVTSGWLNPKSKAEIPAGIIKLIPHDSLGIKIEPWRYTAGQISEICLQNYNVWREIWPIDGIVIKVNDQAVRARDGHNNRWPLWAIAWKPPITLRETVCKGITWNVTRTNRIVPTVVFAPVEIDGSTIQFATGNNASWIRRMGIKRGMALSIGKAGEIIPQIVSAQIPASPLADENGELIYLEDTIQIPRTCPACNELLISKDRDLCCPNENCLGNVIERLAYFYSASGIDLKGVGPATCEKLANSYLGQRFKEKPWLLLKLPADKELVKELVEIFGAVSAIAIHDSVVRAMDRWTAADILIALGVKGLGKRYAEKFIQYIKGAPINVARIPIKVREAFTENLETFIGCLQDLEDWGFRLKEIRMPGHTRYAITGTFNFDRETIVELLAERGYEYSAHGVTKEVAVLFVGRLPRPSSKLIAAKRLGTRLATEEELYKIIGDMNETARV